MDIDSAIDDLSAAIAAFGLPTPTPPADLSTLDEIEAAISPLALPADLRRFWTRVDPATMRVSHGSRLTSPNFALDSWKTAPVELGVGVDPPQLFLIGYESLTCLSVELDSPGHQGGTIWDWSLDGSSLRLAFPDLATYLTTTAEWLREGRVDGFEPGDSWAYIDEDADDNPLRVALVTSPDDGPKRHDVRTWPVHWQEAAGFSAADSVPRDSFQTIGRLLGTDPALPASATIRGEVVSVFADWIVVRDETGEIGMNWPASMHFGPRLGVQFELDVEISPGDRHPGPEPWPASETKGLIGSMARSLFERFQPNGGARPATLLAVRPLD